MDRIGENQPPKKPRTNRTGPPKPEKPHVPYQKPLDKDQLRRDTGAFYGEARAPEIDVNKLYQASKAKQAGVAPGVPQELKNDREFKYHQNKFYAQSVAAQSEMARDERHFYKDAGEAPVSNLINKKSAHFKKDNAGFYGQDY
jgi:hypothetical protein